jgi:hypothetical protein
MLEVHSPIPLQEGESIAFGINTKHVIHFLFGLVVSSPFMVIGLIVLPLLHASPWAVLVFGGIVGFLFAILRYQNRPLAEFLLLTMRFSRRPKLVLYDRQYRIRVHRKVAEKQNGRDLDK